MDDERVNPELRRLVLEVVENQINENDPPETRQTIDRLVAEGISTSEARRMVAAAVTVEIFHILNDKQPFQLERYRWNLARLPQELFDSEGNALYGRE